jgi:metal-sulfur cluster biosynthetic enzyme
MNTELLSASPFPYRGPPELQRDIVAALMQVVDPELALSVVDLGLIYGIEVEADRVGVTMTMTSAACPVTDLITEDVEAELERVLPAGCWIEVKVVWSPPWTPAMMSDSARRFME